MLLHCWYLLRHVSRHIVNFICLVFQGFLSLLLEWNQKCVKWKHKNLCPPLYGSPGHGLCQSLEIDYVTSISFTGVEYISKKYICNLDKDCNKGFKSMTDLKAHQVVHTKAKPFKCTECELSFAQKSSLSDHLNVHQKKYQCIHCQSCFGRQRYLDAHHCSIHAVGGESELTLQNMPNENSNTIILVPVDL